MFESLKAAVTPPVSARDALIRLLTAMVLGFVVSWIYRRTRPRSTTGASLQATLVLLAILIAAVTQVIGDNTARAFSLVGALSIIRFRTVVQDTQDTAFVIFAVVMGMASGANTPWVALIGLLVAGGAAFAMRTPHATAAATASDYTLTLRVGLGHDIEASVRGPFAAHLSRHRLTSIETAKQGTAVDATYSIDFAPAGSAEALVKVLNRTDGVQDVKLQDMGLDDD
jgi:hypothetical protein